MNIEKVTLRLFWLAMVACASLVIGGIWFGEVLPEAYFKTAATFFIVGLANFLVWAPTITYRFLATQQK